MWAPRKGLGKPLLCPCARLACECRSTQPETESTRAFTHLCAPAVRGFPISAQDGSHGGPGSQLPGGDRRCTVSPPSHGSADRLRPLPVASGRLARRGLEARSGGRCRAAGRPPRRAAPGLHGKRRAGGRPGRPRRSRRRSVPGRGWIALRCAGTAASMPALASPPRQGGASDRERDRIRVRGRVPRSARRADRARFPRLRILP